jgi:hypothetical protein
MTPAKSAAPAHCDGGAGRQELEHLAGRLKVQATPEAVGAQVSTIAAVVIAVAPIERGLYSATLDGRVIVARSMTPFYDAPRALFAEGCSSNTALVMRDVASGVDVLVVTVGQAAKRTVAECDRDRPRFRGRKPFRLREWSPLVRPGERAATTPGGQE